jgi:hypothetical protein
MHYTKLLQYFRERRCETCPFRAIALAPDGITYLYCTSVSRMLQPCFMVANCTARKYNRNYTVSSLEKNERKRQQNEKTQRKEAKPWFQTFSP